MASTTRLSIVDTAKSTLVIEDFSSRDFCQWSSVFHPPSLPDNRFQLGIFPINTLPNFANDILFNLWFNSSENDDELSVQYRVSILDASGVKHCTREVLWNYTDDSKYGRDHSIIRLVPSAHLLDPANGLLPEGNLTIYCEVDILSNKIPHITEASFQPTSKLEDNIQKDFESLLTNGKLSDVVLVVGQKELHAHKNILAARSKVFGAMFENKETKESQENRVVIPDMDGEVFEQLLMYIYTGKIPSMENGNALALFVVSDKYELNHLKSICEQSLGSSLTIESVVGTFMVADMHQAVDLKAKCIQYIAEHSDKVMATDGWKQFVAANRFELLHQLFEAISAKLICNKK